MNQVHRAPIRRAAVDDVAELVRLRHAMFRDMAKSGAATRPDAVEDTSWHATAAEMLRLHLTDDSLVACVIDDPHGRHGAGPRLIGCAVAQLSNRLPGPGFPTGLSGSLSTVYVEPAHRVRGCGRVLTQAVLDWLQAAEAEVVDLHATPHSEELYRSLGFAEPASLAMRRLLYPSHQRP